MLENPKTSDRAAARLPRRGSPDAGATAATAATRQGVNLKLSFPGSNPHPQIVGFDLLPAKVAYYRSIGVSAILPRTVSPARVARAVRSVLR